MLQVALLIFENRQRKTLHFRLNSTFSKSTQDVGEYYSNYGICLLCHGSLHTTHIIHKKPFTCFMSCIEFRHVPLDFICVDPS